MVVAISWIKHWLFTHAHIHTKSRMEGDTLPKNYSNLNNNNHNNKNLNNDNNNNMNNDNNNNDQIQNNWVVTLS